MHQIGRDSTIIVPSCVRINVGESTLPWAITALGHLVFFKSEENKYFSPYAYCFIFKSDLLNPNFVQRNHILYWFSWKVTFSLSKVNFWMFGFIET